MTRLLYPGSFDPFTRGHAAIALRAAKLGDVTIGVAKNAGKRSLFSTSERVSLVRATLAEVGASPARFEVVVIPGLVARWAQENGVDAIVKGLRGATDAVTEIQQAQINDRLDAPPTVLVPAPEHLQAVSSSVAKELAAYGGDTSWMVTASVALRLEQRLRERT